MNKRIIGKLVFIVIILLVFKDWFSLGEITSGDAAFYYQKNLRELPLIYQTWSNLGIGQVNNSFFWYYFLPFKLLSFLNIPWVFMERLVFYWPFLLISILSSWFFIMTVLPKLKMKFLTPLIFLLNSYALMIIGGGQISIALAYSISPLIIALFIRRMNKNDLVLSIITGLALTLQFSFEPRITALTVLIIVLYAFTKYFLKILCYIQLFIIPIIIVIGMNFYWIIPRYILNRDTYIQNLTSLDWLKFLSSADFSKTISLLHPNWPENLFGKTFFMKPEFLLIPILAYSLLLFFNKYTNDNLQTRKNILFFSILGLVGAFLAKGINPPLGEIYKFLYERIPGFNMFRDPTKFYLLTALSYSLLIPFSIELISKFLKEKFNNQKVGLFNKILKNLHNFFILSIFIYLLMLIKPAWTEELQGTFETKNIPQEYLELKTYISNQNKFFRTLWIPGQQRYGYYDSNHPAISAYSYYNVSDPIILLDVLRNPEKERELQNLSVKYLIIPLDIDGDFFNKDWKLDPVARQIFEEEVDKIPYLTNKTKIGGITRYEITDPKSHFWVVNGNTITYKYFNPTKYSIGGNLRGETTIIFSEKFDPLWEIKIDNKIIKSEKYKDNLNSFTINTNGKWQATVEFSAQKYVQYGLIVCGITLVSSIVLLLFAFKKKI